MGGRHMGGRTARTRLSEEGALWAQSGGVRVEASGHARFGNGVGEALAARHSQGERGTSSASVAHPGASAAQPGASDTARVWACGSSRGKPHQQVLRTRVNWRRGGAREGRVLDHG